MIIKRLIFPLFLLLLLRTALPAQVSLPGEFTVTKIIDGDTFKFDKLDRPARLLGIDTEESFKGPEAESRTAEVSADWPKKYFDKREVSLRPVKTESPFGLKTTQWANELFKDVVKVRLEPEDTLRAVDFYGRYLVYLIGIRSDGSEFNYNIECVKQGYSPYFNKYGNSKRFDSEFKDAQKYASEHMLGIWSGMEQCYPDYPERLQWWERRSASLELFEKKYRGLDGYISALNAGDFNRLGEYLGRTVTVFGSISEILDSKEPFLLRLSFSIKEHIDVTVFPEKKHLMIDMNIRELEGEYIYVSGILSEYKGSYQINLNSKEQIWME